MCCERRAEKARESTGEYVRGAHEGARVEERTWLGKARACKAREARSSRAVVDALKGSRDSFLSLFIWVYVQMLVGRRLSG